MNVLRNIIEKLQKIKRKRNVIKKLLVMRKKLDLILYFLVDCDKGASFPNIYVSTYDYLNPYMQLCGFITHFLARNDHLLSNRLAICDVLNRFYFVYLQDNQQTTYTVDIDKINKFTPEEKLLNSLVEKIKELKEIYSIVDYDVNILMTEDILLGSGIEFVLDDLNIIISDIMTNFNIFTEKDCFIHKCKIASSEIRNIHAQKKVDF